MFESIVLVLQKNPFFRNQENILKTFLRKQRKKEMLKWLFTLFIYIHMFIIQRQFGTENLPISMNNLSAGLKHLCFITSIFPDIGGFQIYIFCVFMKFEVLVRPWIKSLLFQDKTCPTSQYCEIGFKFPLFLWNLEHNIELQSAPRRVTTRGLGWVHVIWIGCRLWHDYPIYKSDSIVRLLGKISDC